MLDTIHGCHHYTIVADPGTHSYKDRMFSLAYSWELKGGGFLPFQELTSGKKILPSEAALHDDIMALRDADKLE